MNASALMRLERGERRLTVEDVVALALALDVAPVHLMVPLEPDAPVEVAEGVVHEARTVRAWFQGKDPLPGRDREAFHQETPLALWMSMGDNAQRWEDARRAEHEALDRRVVRREGETRSLEELDAAVREAHKRVADLRREREPYTDEGH